MVVCGGGGYLSCSGDAAELLVAVEHLTAQLLICDYFDVVSLMPVFIELSFSSSDLHTRDNADGKGTTYSSGGDGTVPCAKF